MATDFLWFLSAGGSDGKRVGERHRDAAAGGNHERDGKMIRCTGGRMDNDNGGLMSIV
jgi:hypothetical protein